MTSQTIRSFAEYRTVGEAATYLGVSPATLRNWDRTGKLKPRRHPQNGYRIYLHEDLELVLRSADRPTLIDESLVPRVMWSEVGDSEHFVQFYEDDEYLVDSVSGFVGAGLADGAGTILIATPEHRTAVESKLKARGFDLSETTAAGRYVVLDAAETLSKFMVDGRPDEKIFSKTVGSVVERMTRGGRRVRAFGEMVALLWGSGNKDAAIQLEEFWNGLAKNHRFALFCAYPVAEFDHETDGTQFNGICNCHSRVIPAESYAGVASPDERLRVIALLQQKAQSLEAEITHRRAVENDLARREREFADFFENATEGLHKVGPDGIILWANSAEHSLLGYTADEYVGHSIREFHVDTGVVDDMLCRLRRGDSLENFRARLRCKDGHIKHVLVNANACFEDGEFAYARCFTRDVTRQWQAENALSEASRRKDAFLATLAHELRNPLAPIASAVQLLQSGDADGAGVKQAHAIMERQVQHMTRLVDDLLDVSRITRDQIELRRERVELATVIQNAVETSRPLIDSARHELAVNLPADRVILDADPARMAQVFSNLLNNSAKYTEPGGRIHVSAHQVEGEVIVTVQDNGVGIARDALAYVFDMFRQVDRSLERSQGGLGIGLTLVRRLVEVHGGSINAQSDGLGKGSTFSVRLPVAPESLRREKAPLAASKVRAAKRRLLVVDDNIDGADTLSLLLSAKGHEIRTARDGLEAIEISAEFRPEIILMDVGMPKLDGYDATRHIRQMPFGRDIFIVALTGWGQPDDIKRSQEAGFSAHLVKPVDVEALEQLLTVRETQGR